MNQYINEVLKERVGLEKLYAFKVKDNLVSRVTGKQINGLFCYSTKEILLDSSLGDSPRKCVAIYLHEVGHLLALEYCMDTSPNADAHNPYFAVLVVTMYRRANLLEYLKLYDFCDTSAGQRAYHLDEMPEDEELIARFEYIVRRSASLANSDLSMEQLATKLYFEDYRQHIVSGIFPTPSKSTTKTSWLKICIYFFALTGFAAVSGAIAASIFP
ncbi:hypothetical protein ACO0LM_12320 [Undibacterium sp. Di26W]|uniref:hypothetical protein n=1 Tax=Undibacterium sp. Di26W TaxID=3413035 RepID=UPI003BF01C0F